MSKFQLRYAEKQKCWVITNEVGTVRTYLEEIDAENMRELGEALVRGSMFFECAGEATEIPPESIETESFVVSGYMREMLYNLETGDVNKAKDCADNADIHLQNIRYHSWKAPILCRALWRPGIMSECQEEVRCSLPIGHQGDHKA